MEHKDNNNPIKKAELNSAHKTEGSSSNKIRKASSDHIVEKIHGANEKDIKMTTSQKGNVETAKTTMGDNNTVIDYKPKRFVTQENQNTREAEREYQERLRKHPGEERRSSAYSRYEEDSQSNISQSLAVKTSLSSTNSTATTTAANNQQNLQNASAFQHPLDKKGEYTSATVTSSGGIRKVNMRFEQDLLGASEVQLSSNKRLRLSGFGETTTNIVGRTAVMAFSMTVSQTEAGQGARYAKVAVQIGAFATAEIVRRRLNAPLKAELVRKYGTSKPEVALRDINRVLRANNIQTLRGKGSDLANLSARNLKRLRASGKMVPPEVIEALKQGKELGMLTTFKEGKRGSIRNISQEISSLLMRQISQNEAGQGLRISTSVLTRVRSTLRRTISLARNSAHLAVISTRKAVLHSIKRASKMALKASERSAKYELVGNVEKATQLEKKATKLSEKAQKRHERFDKAHKFSNKISEIKEKISDPFGMKRKLRNVRRQISQRINRVLGTYVPGFSKFQKFQKAIAKLFAKIANIVRSLLTALWSAVGAGIIIVLVAALVIIIITTAVGSFDMSDDKARDIAIKTLEECYLKDLETIADLNYNEITIIYEDVKDEQEYTDKKGDADAQAFYQSSNCAEILAMSFVWAEHDFSSVSKHSLKDYVKGLWYGSHDIIVQEQTIIIEDEDGEEEIIKNATVTYRTYYFNSLFDCKQRSSPSPIQYTEDTDDVGGCASSWDQIYVWLRNNGFNFVQTCGIMGNLAYETGGCANNNNVNSISKQTFLAHPPNPETDTSSGYGIFQWIGGRKKNAKSYIKSFGGDEYSSESQLKAMKHEIKTDSYEKSQWNTYVKPCTTAQDAGYQFAAHIERCGEAYRTGRGTMANKIAGWYQDYEDDWGELINQGQQIADYAKTFAGKLHYAGDGSSWRGFSLSTTNGGTDCSGFVALIYQACLPKAKQNNFVGTAAGYYNTYYSDYGVTDPQPGDVVVNPGKTHTGIYIGGGQYVNASWYNCGQCKKKGGPCDNDCKISNVPEGSYYIRIWQKFSN